MKYLAPLYLGVVFFFFCKDNLGAWISAVSASFERQLALGLIGAVIFFLVVCVRIGEQRWRSQGLDIDDSRPLKDTD
jgi:hypothetical protein